MSSPFPVLNNKPIDQWRVTELKEELKKRKLPLKGLKEELVRRLDESLREEMDQVEKEETPEEETTPPFRSLTGEEEEEVVDNGCEEENTEIAPEGKTEAEITPEEKPASEITPEEKTETEFVAPEEKIDTEITPEEKTETQKAIPEENTENQMITPEEKTESKIGLEEKTKSAELKSEAVLEENATYDEEKKPKNEQVSEQVQVGNGTGTGTQIKCESNSNTQSESISVKNDNLNTDNFDLEKQQVEVKQDEQGDQNKNKSASNDNNNNNINNNENNNNNDNENNNEKCEIANEGGSPEKLSLDRSSADDSMEEVNYENAPDISSVEGVEGGNYENAPKVSDLMDEAKAPAEKRKLEAEETAQANENVKRQRRWNNDSVEVPERETPNLSQPDTPKDSISPSVNKHAFNRSDSNLSTDSPKERIVPASQNAATNSLRIDRFLRPFTLKAVQDLLGKTGTVSSFWMDHIKTHCYVTYSTVEEAEATRNAVYNLKWPSNGGNQLIAEFVDPAEVKTRLEAPPPVASTPKPPPQQQPPAFSRQNSATRNAQPVREQQLPPPPAVRERLPPPPPLKKTDPTPAVVTLDDLFRKTKATPRIYYLPCSEEKVAAKLAARAKAAKE